MNQNDHVGKRLLRVKLGNGITPSFSAIVPASADGPFVCHRIHERLMRVLSEQFGDLIDWSLGKDNVIECLSCDLIEAPDVREAKWEQFREQTSKAMDRRAEEIGGAMDSDPHNGTLGWWRVSGVRHSAIVKTDSARKAVEKAGGCVGDWESPDADWIGEELPEVIEC